MTYDCYRALLSDFFAHKKSLRAGFTYRRFSHLAGLKSPNYLQLVMQGKRNLSVDTASPVADALKLTGAEKTYFLALVAHASAATQKERDAAQRQMLVSTRQALTTEMSKAHSEVLRSWHHLVIREMTFLPDFCPSASWISNRLSNLVSPEQAEESLALLQRAGLLQPNSTGGLSPAEPVLDTGDNFSNKLDASQARRMLDYHLQVFAVWRRRLEELSPEDRELALLNIPLNHSRLAEFKERLRAFQDEIIGWVKDEPDPQDIYQLGLCLLPLTRRLEP